MDSACAWTWAHALKCLELPWVSICLTDCALNIDLILSYRAEEFLAYLVRYNCLSVGEIWVDLRVTTQARFCLYLILGVALLKHLLCFTGAFLRDTIDVADGRLYVYERLFGDVQRWDFVQVIFIESFVTVLHNSLAIVELLPDFVQSGVTVESDGLCKEAKFLVLILWVVFYGNVVQFDSYFLV